MHNSEVKSMNCEKDYILALKGWEWYSKTIFINNFEATPLSCASNLKKFQALQKDSRDQR